MKNWIYHSVLWTIIGLDLTLIRETIGLYCYSCVQQTSVSDCKRIAACGVGQVCMLKANFDSVSISYGTGCEDKNVCLNQIRNSDVTNVLGRKRSSSVQDIREPFPLLKTDGTLPFLPERDNRCVLKCCDEILCNGFCNFTIAPVAATANSTHPITTSRSCPVGTESFGGSCYMFANREMTFDSAKTFCSSHHGYLVHVDTATENNFLKKKLAALNRGPVQYWIGITDQETENIWKFYDNSKVAPFYDWVPGEPDGRQSLDGNIDPDCAVFDPFSNFQWRDEDCSPYQVSDAICEIS